MGGAPSNALIALAAAVLWGAGDFAGGMGVRGDGEGMAAALRFVLFSHGVGLCLLLCLAFAHGDALPHGAPLAWGVGAGISGGLAVTVFYVALSRGAMGTAAAVSGLLAATLPSLLSAVLEGAPGWKKLAGFCAAGLAIWLIGAGKDDGSGNKGLTLAVLSGAGFGVFFIALRFAGAAGVVWPMATARMASVALCGLLSIVWPRSQGIKRASRSIVVFVLAAAVLDARGNLFFVAATRAGRLDVAAVLASLYPVTTILLAAWCLREFLHRDKHLEWGSLPSLYS